MTNNKPFTSTFLTCHALAIARAPIRSVGGWLGRRSNMVSTCSISFACLTCSVDWLTAWLVLLHVMRLLFVRYVWIIQIKSNQIEMIVKVHYNMIIYWSCARFPFDYYVFFFFFFHVFISLSIWVVRCFFCVSCRNNNNTTREETKHGWTFQQNNN